MINKADIATIFSLLKIAAPLSLVISVSIGAVLWIQNQGSDKYYTKESGAYLEKNITKLDGNIKSLEQKLGTLESTNMEIIRLLGRLEAIVEISLKDK